MKKVEKKIKEAPNYVINQDGVVFNDTTKGVVGESKGSVRLIVFGMRKSFKVSELKEQYFPEGWESMKEEVVAETPAAEVPAVKEKTKDKSKKDKSKKERSKKDEKPKTEKKVGDKVLSTETRAGKIRVAYDKNPENFDIYAYSKKTGINKGVIKATIAHYIAHKLQKDEK